MRATGEVPLDEQKEDWKKMTREEKIERYKRENGTYEGVPLVPPEGLSKNALKRWIRYIGGTHGARVVKAGMG